MPEPSETMAGLLGHQEWSQTSHFPSPPPSHLGSPSLTNSVPLTLLLKMLSECWFIKGSKWCGF